MSGRSASSSGPQGIPSLDSSSASGTVRLPRLDVLDSSSTGRHLASQQGRYRSVSSASYDTQPLHSDQKANFSPISPQRDFWGALTRANVPEGPSTATRASIGGLAASEDGRLLAGPSATSPTAPKLPNPLRRSTMMSGGLPPLPTLQIPSIDRSYLPFRQPPQRDLHTADSAPGSSSDSHPSSEPGWNSTGTSSHFYTEDGRGHSGLPQQSSYLSPPGLSHSAEVNAKSRKVAKAHVSSACLNCKRAHLACDAERPCRRCSKLGKTATCVDVQHKKRGRPRLKERENASSSGAMKTSPHLVSSDSTDSGWSPSTDPHGQFVPRGTVPAAWSSSPEAQESRPPMTLAASGGLRTFSVASQKMIAMDHHTSHAQPPVTTILCGTDLIAEHVSQESQALFGLSPSVLFGRSILDIVHPEDVRRLYDAWGRLLGPVGLGSVSFPKMSLDMMQGVCKLVRPARGTIFVEDILRMRTSDRSFTSCSLRLHLGGAFGFDLYRPETKAYAFVVLSVVPVDGHSSEVVTSSLHPDAARIHAAEYPVGDGKGRVVFQSPVSSPPHTSMATLSKHSNALPRTQHHQHHYQQQQQQQQQQQRQQPPQRDTMLLGAQSLGSPSIGARNYAAMPQKKRSSEGVLLNRFATSSCPSPPSLRATGLTSAPNVTSGQDFTRPVKSEGTLSGSKVILSAGVPPFEGGKGTQGSTDAIILDQAQQSRSAMAQRHVQPQLQYGHHRPFSTAALPFSTLKNSTIRPPQSVHQKTTTELYDSTSGRGREKGDSYHQASRDGSTAFFAGESTGLQRSAAVERSTSPATTSAAAASMLRLRGSGGVRLTGSVSSSRSTQGVAEGVGAVAC